MSSRRGGGKPNNSTGKTSLSWGDIVAEEQLSSAVSNVSLDSAQDDGDWEVISRKSKNKAAVNSNARARGPQSSNQMAWVQPDAGQKYGTRNNVVSGRPAGNSGMTQTSDFRRPSGRGNARVQPSYTSLGNNHMAPQPIIGPPLEQGWKWQSRPGSSNAKGPDNDLKKDDNFDVNDEDPVDDEDDEEDADAIDDTDDDLLSEDFDSDTSQQSYESRKKNRWFKKFFESLDNLSVEEINEPERQWHCPACQNGPGAIDWYKGLQPLMTHAKTKGSKRVKLHRELAELLEEELLRRGTSVIPAGEIYGKWRGLKDEEKDHEIVWPPIVIIMNTRLDKDDNDKWIGMGNQELLDYFSQYAAVKARHSYGPQGHRGMSLLIFESSARGYLEAERLDKHFTDQGTDRNAWERRGRILFNPGGERQLYGYMALKEDLDIFNQHSHGKSKLKYDMRSYIEMVVKQLDKMSEDNQQLIYYRNKAVQERRNAKALQQSFGIVSEKLRQTMEENRIVRQRTQVYHEQQKEELDFQEKFFQDQIEFIHKERDAKEENFEKLQQEEREKVKQLNENSSNNEDYRRRVESFEKFIQLQDKEMEEYVVQRDELIKAHEEKMTAMKRRHWEELVGLEQEFDGELNNLMKKYSPQPTAL